MFAHRRANTFCASGAKVGAARAIALLASLATTKSSIIRELLRSPQVSPLRLLVGIRFQVCFTPLIGVLFTFPSRYSFPIGHHGVLRLGGWSPHVQTGLLVPRLTQGPQSSFPIRGCHPLRPAFPDGSGTQTTVTGLFRFRSPLLAESL